MIEGVITDTKIKTPRQISDEVFSELSSSEYGTILSHVLPAYVQKYIVDRRKAQNLGPDDVVIEDTFAPDDLLSDDVADIVTKDVQKKVAQAGSSKVNKIRNEWKRRLQDRVHNGSEYKIFGDFTADDLRGAAASLKAMASSYEAKSAWYENLANAIPAGKTLSALDKDPTK